MSNWSVEIIEQLGGNKFKVMTGAKDFVWDDERSILQFKIGKNPKRITNVRIQLSNDLYNLSFYQLKNFEMLLRSSAGSVYNEDIRKVFEKHTELSTSL